VLVPMVQLEVLGQRRFLEDVLAALQPLRAAEVVRDASVHALSEAGFTADAEAALPQDSAGTNLPVRIERLLTLVEPQPVRPMGSSRRPNAGRIEQLVEQVEASVAGPLARLEQLREEADRLPRMVVSLEALLPLVPGLAGLSDADLAALSLATVAVVLDDPDGAVVEVMRGQLREMLGDRHLLVAAPVDGAVGCLLVVPAREVAAVESVLGRDRITTQALPEQYAARSLVSAVVGMRTRLEDLPGQTAAARSTLSDAVVPHAHELSAARDQLAAQAERLEAGRHAVTGRRTFALRLWTPRHRVVEVRQALARLGVPVVVDDVRSRDQRGSAPVLLRNLAVFQPFERLVGFLSWPSPHSLDPTGLMAVVLPLLFGVMVGDVAYGLLLLGLAWLVRRRWAQRSAVAGDLAKVLAAGAAWSVVFGLLYGELLGDLGKTLFGMPALWFYRGGPDALMPLLLFVLGLGVAHIVLGLLLGLWLAVQERHLGHGLEHGGTLLVLVGLFAIALGALSVLPQAVVTPGVALVVVGVVLASVVHGKMGVLLGPLELIGTLGSILSYLRLAAVGLASVYLAIVANELARQAPLVFGVIIAAFFHALNLALAAFSPMVQSLRLHYVEFFGRFYDGGGRLFAPLGAGLPETAVTVPRQPTGHGASPAAGPSAAPVLVPAPVGAP